MTSARRRLLPLSMVIVAGALAAPASAAPTPTPGYWHGQGEDWTVSFQVVKRKVKVGVTERGRTRPTGTRTVTAWVMDDLVVSSINRECEGQRGSSPLAFAAIAVGKAGRFDSLRTRLPRTNPKAKVAGRVVTANRIEGVAAPTRLFPDEKRCGNPYRTAFTAAPGADPALKPGRWTMHVPEQPRPGGTEPAQAVETEVDATGWRLAMQDRFVHVSMTCTGGTSEAYIAAFSFPESFYGLPLAGDGTLRYAAPNQPGRGGTIGLDARRVSAGEITGTLQASGYESPSGGTCASAPLQVRFTAG